MHLLTSLPALVLRGMTVLVQEGTKERTVPLCIILAMLSMPAETEQFITQQCDVLGVHEAL